MIHAKNANLINYSAENSKKKNLNILIIDDDIKVAECLKEYLELRGHVVTTVDEGTRGIYQFYINNFDLIFLDYHLNKDGSPIYCQDKKENFNKSNLDGAIISQCLKGFINNEKKFLIFAYTGDSSQKAINKFKKAGMDGVIFKPIDIIILNKFMTSLETRDINKTTLNEIFRGSKNSLLLFNI